MNKLNYDELYYLIVDQNDQAQQLLYQDVQSYLQWLCYVKGNDFLRQEDIMSYGWQGYIEAFNSYNPDKNANFKSFLQHCISRRLIDVQRKRNKKTLKGHMSGLLMSETSVQYIVENKRTNAGVTDLQLVFSDYWETLSAVQKEIFISHIVGKSVTEIAQQQQMSEGNIYKYIRELKNVLKKMILD